MKTRFLTVILCFALSVGSLSGQERESLRITNLTVSLTKTDSVEVIFSVTYNSSNTTRGGGLLLTPFIMGGEGDTELPYIYIEKPKSRREKLVGNRKIACDSLMIIKAGVLSNYSVKMPFEEWMDGAQMKLNIERINPHGYNSVSSKVLHNDIVLKKEKPVVVEQNRPRWTVTDKLEFLFSPKGLDEDIVQSIVQGNHAKAIESLLTLEKDADVWNTLGVAYGYSGEFEKACSCFEAAEKDGLKIATLNIRELDKKVTKEIQQ